MSTYEILQLGNPLLWEKSVQVENFRSTEIETLIADLSDTLAAFRTHRGYGRAIAAPQIGTLKRVIFVRMEGFCHALINPVITQFSDEQMELWDDCFSFPDLMVRVSRAAEIKVEYYDEHAAKQVITAETALAELLQHEIDHLDGILAIERALSPHAFATRTAWQQLYQ